MAQIRGTAGYNLSNHNAFGAPSRGDMDSDPSPLDAIREQTSKIEDFLDTLSDPVKPYVRPRHRQKLSSKTAVPVILPIDICEQSIS
jgi:hypothetical protein